MHIGNMFDSFNRYILILTFHPELPGFPGHASHKLPLALVKANAGDYVEPAMQITDRDEYIKSGPGYIKYLEDEDIKSEPGCIQHLEDEDTKPGPDYLSPALL